MWAVRLNTVLRADDAGKTIGNMRALPGKNMTVVNLLLSDALMHRFYILGEKYGLGQRQTRKDDRVFPLQIDIQLIYFFPRCIRARVALDGMPRCGPRLTSG